MTKQSRACSTEIREGCRDTLSNRRRPIVPVGSFVVDGRQSVSTTSICLIDVCGN